jgi:undecaprenyl-diphosphatase
MILWQALLLGLLQGVTEFLPISSSGHLALAQMLIPGFAQPGVFFDAMLHLGTAGAVVWYERHQIASWIHSATGRRMLALLAVGSVAFAVIALPLRDLAIVSFLNPFVVGVALIVTGAVVGSTRFLAGGMRTEADMTWRHAAAVGLVQGLAIFPGVSRSGLTIAAGLGCGLERSWAARFSFLLSVPAILGVAFVEMLSARALTGGNDAGFLFACLVGAVAAGVSGFFALRVVIRAVSSRVFHRFAWYCIPLGLLVLALSWGWR